MNNFNWEQFENGYVGGSKLQINEKIPGQTNKNRCFSHEVYSKDLWDIYNNKKIIKKDLAIGDVLKVVGISNIKEDKITLEFLNGYTHEINLNNEKKFIQLFGYDNILSFTEMLKDKGNREIFISNDIEVFVIDIKPTIKISLWQGYIRKKKEEFLEQIKKPTKAYTAKIIEANKGGYFVEVQGLEAFMPGSLAAANKLNDFKLLLGKTVVVMIEDFLPEMNSFIVSHKKYLDYVLPERIKELDLNVKYEGDITGCSKYGIFIEFGNTEDIKFTGLLHTSKMTEETKAKFEKCEYKPGDKISFYIGEITKDLRIILDEEFPKIKLEKLEKFIIENKGKLLEAKIVSIQNFGIIVNIDEQVGLIPIIQFKMNKIEMKNFLVNDKIPVYVDKIKEGKLVLKLSDNK